MSMQARWWMAGTLACGMLAACSSPTGSGGGGGGGGNMDSGMMGGDSGPAVDRGPTTDRGPATDRGPTPDRGPPPSGNPCMDAMTAMGTPDAMGAIHIMGNNTNGAPVTLGMLPMACVNGGRGGDKGMVVVYRYRMRTAANLEVSTANPGTTDAMFDSIVVILGMCSASAPSLACNDDLGMAGGAGHGLHSRARTTTPLMMGQEVFVVVGGFGDGPEAGSTGTFELTIREIASTPIGMRCTAMSVCATGSACIANDGTPTMGTCLADGGVRARCRVMGAACDMGLACSVATPTVTTPGNCQRSVMIGADCAAAGTVCATGSSCQPDLVNPALRTCVADGVRGGRCRLMDPRCDSAGGVQCSSNMFCRAEVPAGMACDSTGRTTFCAASTSCAAGMMAGTFVCVGDGTAAGAACRLMGMACDAGMTCSAAMPTATAPGFCQRTAMAGGACDWVRETIVCPATAPCAPNSRTGGLCTMPRMETEPNNTPMMPQAAVTASTVFSGSVEAAGQDCFAVTVPMGAGIYARSDLPMTPTCPGPAGMNPDPLVKVYNPMGVEIASVDDGRGLCGTLSPLTTAAVRGLAAGNYVVCISGFPAMGMGTALPNYNLTIGIVPAM